MRQALEREIEEMKREKARREKEMTDAMSRLEEMIPWQPKRENCCSCDESVVCAWKCRNSVDDNPHVLCTSCAYKLFYPEDAQVRESLATTWFVILPSTGVRH